MRTTRRDDPSLDECDRADAAIEKLRRAVRDADRREDFAGDYVAEQRARGGRPLPSTLRARQLRDVGDDRVDAEVVETADAYAARQAARGTRPLPRRRGGRPVTINRGSHR